MDSATLQQWVTNRRQRFYELVEDLTDEQLRVPWLPTINLILWEICHASYFYEFFLLRQGAGQEPVRPDSDALFDSMHIGHEARWRLPLPDRAGCFAYIDAVHERVCTLIEKGLDERTHYLLLYSIFHGDMHHEALAYTRQTLGFAAPLISSDSSDSSEKKRDRSAKSEEVCGDASVAGGTFILGAPDSGSFCFDNEKWGHPIEVEPFKIARTAVSEADFQEFVLAGGYQRAEFWSVEGWAWRQGASAGLPLYWRRAGERDFERRIFSQWLPLDPQRAMIHVNWYEANAWCRWANRRLPTEAEWEMAAAADESSQKRRHPWGDEDPSGKRSNLGFVSLGPVDVSAFSQGDSYYGCRQMTGNVWEWTSSTFAPYPGFVPDMYSDYSQVSFHTRKVLRGGCWATSFRTIRNTWRNFFQPARNDIFAGFRSCAR